MPTETGAGGRLRLVTDVLRTFADATTDYARLLDIIVERVAGLLGHACSIRLLTADGAGLETAALHDPEGDADFKAATRVMIPVSPSLRQALDRGQAFVQPFATPADMAADHALTAQREAVESVLVAPLVARGAALGLLLIIRRHTNGATFEPDDIDLAEALSHHAAIAIANARLMASLETLERARAHERSILDTVGAPLLLIDPDGLLIGANRAFLDAFGLAEDDAIGRPLLTVARGALAVPEMRELYQDLPPSSGVDGIEIELVTATGARTYLVRTKKTFRPGNGSQTTLITLVDLTDRKIAERGARRRALLVASMNEALIGIDLQFHVLEWNPAAERLFGWTPAEVIGRPIADIFETVEGADRDEGRSRLQQGSTVRAQVRIRNRDGKWVDVSYSTMPLVERDVTTGYVCVMLDVTERVRLEGELRERVEQLTTANSELESFSYSVSHDLRAPVRAIDGFSEILEEEHGKVLDEEGRRMLGLVRKNAKRMGLLIDDILALARYSRHALVTAKVDMTALARAALDEAVRAEPGRKITATIAPLPHALGDDSLLRQVWLNLFANAVKYTRGRDEAVIEASAVETDDEIVYTVKDNGAGFDMRYVDKLFGVFERLHSTHEFEGTGIGLALVARIVKRHDGRVWGEGKVGGGATFHVALPKAQKRKAS